MNFKLTSEYQPTGDQPEAIRQLTEGVERGDRAQVLLGVTGSGKTFTVANVIANVNKPTLILSHNKTLAAQLYEEMKGFFPENAVEYYVSYYDYYQPEAYMPATDLYIEKDLAINDVQRRPGGLGIWLRRWRSLVSVVVRILVRAKWSVLRVYPSSIFPA